MWHVDLSQLLAKKICKTDEILAARFIAHIFYLFETVYENYEIELSMVLGFIKDLYRFAEQNSYRDVPLEEFAELCIGLIILHTKSTDELTIYIRDFIPFLKDDTIFSDLAIEKKIKPLNLSAHKRILFENKENAL